MQNARPAATDSVNDISAIPSAAGHNCAASEISGSANAGNPAGTAPTEATPSAWRLKTAAAAMLNATQTSGADSRGNRYGNPTSTTIPAAATSTVSPWVCGNRPGAPQRADRR